MISNLKEVKYQANEVQVKLWALHAFTQYVMLLQSKLTNVNFINFLQLGKR